MALVPVAVMQWPGHTMSDAGVANANSRQLDTAGEYQAFVHIAKEPMTISHVGLYLNVSGSPTADVRIETVNAADGFPSGTLWATNTNLVTGTLSTNEFTLHQLTAAASIAKGDIFAVRLNYASGTYVYTRHGGIERGAFGQPYEAFSVGTPTKGNLTVWYNWCVGSSANAFYKLQGFMPWSAVTSTAFNNTNSAKKGARFQVPFRCRCCGISSVQQSTGGDLTIVMMDDSGNELGSSATANLSTQRSSTAGMTTFYYFDNPVTLETGTWYRAMLQPDTTTTIRRDTLTVPSADYLTAYPGGPYWYSATYDTSSGWVTDDTIVPVGMDLLIDMLDDGSAGGGLGSFIGFGFVAGQALQWVLR